MSSLAVQSVLRSAGKRSQNLSPVCSLVLVLLLFLLPARCCVSAQSVNPLSSLQLWQVAGCSPNAVLEDSTWLDITTLPAGQVLTGNANSSVAPCVSTGLARGVASLQVACSPLPVLNRTGPLGPSFSASIWLTQSGCPTQTTPDVSYSFIGILSQALPNCSTGVATLYNSSTGVSRRVAMYGSFTCSSPNTAAATLSSTSSFSLALLLLLLSFILA